MLTVSPKFKEKVDSSVKQTEYAVMISWDKQISPDAKFFSLDSSTLNGSDFLKGSGDVITFFDKYSYSDASKYVKNFSISKKVSSYSYGVVSAQATVTLNNGSGRFLPDNGLEIKAGRPIKILTGYDGELISQFVGFCSQPEVNIVDRTVVFKAFDAITFLETKQSDLPAFINQSAHEIIEALLIEQGFSADQYDIDDSLQVPIGYLAVKGKNVTDLLKDLAEAEAALLFVDEQGIIRFWNRTHLAKQQDSVHSFNYSNMKGLKIKSTPIINYVKAKAQPYKIQAFQKLWELEQGNDQTKINPGQTRDIFAEFRDDVADFYAISVDQPVELGQNNGSSYFSATKNDDGSGGALDFGLISVYNFGTKYRIRFKNNSNQAGCISRLQLWGVPAKITQIVTAEAKSEPSVEQYGTNPDTSTGIGADVLKINNNLIQDVGGANAIAHNIINLYSNPNRRFELDNFFVPYLQIGDAVEVNITELAKSYNCFVMGYQLSGGVNANFRQRLYVEERPKVSHFTLNQSTLDNGDILAN